MKTLLLRPFSDAATGISPPLSLMYLSSYLKSRGEVVKIIDNCTPRVDIIRQSMNNHDAAQLLQAIGVFEPDLIGMTLFSRELKEVAEISRLIKQQFPSVTIVLGGPHPTAMPDETLDQIQDCDFVVRGEGEIILYNLVSSLTNKTSLYEVKGISFRLNGAENIHHCPDDLPIYDLDSLPFPDRMELYNSYQGGNYDNIIYGSPSDILITSRGCPFQCKFCFKVCSKFRSRSPEKVLEEIDWVYENIGPESIQFMDDSFTIQRERAVKILDGLIARNYKLKLKVRSRTNAVDEELLIKMKKAGVDTIVYGFESGSQFMLDAFNKGTSVEDNLKAAKLTRKVGLNCLGYMLLFYPGENRETLKETKRFIKQARPTAMNYSVLTPLPSTPIYIEAKENGSLIGDWKLGDKTPWIKTEQFGDLDEMLRISKMMFIKTMLKPFRIFWLLRTYGKVFLRSPSLTLKLALKKFWRKKQIY